MEVAAKAASLFLTTCPSPRRFSKPERNNHRHQLLRKACEAVKDRRRLEAVIRHYAHDWPITSKQRGRPNLKRHFRKDPRQSSIGLRRLLLFFLRSLGQSISSIHSNAGRRGARSNRPFEGEAGSPVSMWHRCRSDLDTQAGGPRTIARQR